MYKKLSKCKDHFLYCLCNVGIHLYFCRITVPRIKRNGLSSQRRDQRIRKIRLKKTSSVMPASNANKCDRTPPLPRHQP